MDKKNLKLQIAVFGLVAATFTNIYITQPVLPVLQDEFGVSPVQVSMTVSIVILGIILSKTLPGKKLNVVMGAYVSATVLGGLGGRLLGGWIHPPFHWRYAFLSASLLIISAMVFACFVLPHSRSAKRIPEKKEDGFFSFLARKDLLLPIACGAAGLLMFRPVINFLPWLSAC